jgi:hypothetical protein
LAANDLPTAPAVAGEPPARPGGDQP